MNVPSTSIEPAASAFGRGLALRRAGQDAAAIAWFQEALRLDPALGAAALEAGELCLWHGRSDEAEPLLVQAMRWASGSGQVGAPSDCKGMAPDAAGEALFAAIDALNAAGLAPFLCGGTALGCAREGGFIGFDTDIDLGVAPGADPAEVIAAIGDAPSLRYLYHDVHAGQVLRVRLASDRGVGGDVFLYQTDEAGWWCGVQRGPTCVRWRDTPFGLARTRFLGRAVLVPHPIERYLQENYGDWRRPDPYHIAAFSAPNLIGGYGPMPRCAAYRAISRALLDGDAGRVRYLCEQVLARDPNDAAVRGLLR